MQPLETRIGDVNAELRSAVGVKSTTPKYLLIAEALERQIRKGRLRDGERLPTVRGLSEQLGVSGTTAAASYKALAQRGLIDSRVGSGTTVTFTAAVPPTVDQDSASDTYVGISRPYGAMPWRRRAQTLHISRLQAAFPHSRNFASGTPNPELLPAAVLKRSWIKAASGLTADSLAYTGPTPVPALADQLIAKLSGEGITARPDDIVIGSSAQQLMTLATKVISTLSRKSSLTIAVEEPGYPTIFDTFERLGHRLVGIQVDQEGAVPGSLDHALSAGADAVLLIPRAHNPTGVSWTKSRYSALANVFLQYPHVCVVEDDQFADASINSVGSLLSVAGLENRVIYVRSFSKSIAPDLRLAAAVVRPRLGVPLMEEKFYADGWSSTLAQSALAYAFSDAELTPFLIASAQTYAGRRTQLSIAILNNVEGLGEVAIPSSVDGPNIWVRLPERVSATAVAERAAAAGVLVAVEEPFSINVGRDNALRLNAGMMRETEIEGIAEHVGQAIRESANSSVKAMFHHSL